MWRLRVNYELKFERDRECTQPRPRSVWVLSFSTKPTPLHWRWHCGCCGRTTNILSVEVLSEDVWSVDCSETPLGFVVSSCTEVAPSSPCAFMYLMTSWLSGVRKSWRLLRPLSRDPRIHCCFYKKSQINPTEFASILGWQHLGEVK